jgi:hypothetical protein
MTVRTFDPEKKVWSIWWLDGRFPGSLDAPMVGSFDNGTGRFFTQDTFQGVPITVRFLWQVKADGTPRWEQAFSADGGDSWETNWTMEFSPLR